jgi:hypothetical protein
MMTDGYRGVIGAIHYAFTASSSLLFKLYVVTSAAAVAIIGIFLSIALVVLIGNTAELRGGSVTLSRSFYVVIGLLLILPAVAPILAIARRHRRGISPSSRFEMILASVGFLFLFSIYLGIVASMPETFVLDGEMMQRPPPSGMLRPVIKFLYMIPPSLSWSVPLGGAVAVGFTYWWYR